MGQVGRGEGAGCTAELTGKRREEILCLVLCGAERKCDWEERGNKEASESTTTKSNTKSHKQPRAHTRLMRERGRGKRERRGCAQ